ncbi:hypothetical protein CEXT_467851 [Caerostris extrusa]|uniref:Uncharacterized protein n=1 Tax=Caerostris extrusa TaxID=172846 RepID=A0AAV4NRL6_CAEEX|nr:hypothetical protein CEXT_114221 [Caerostris extrusa]GIY95024.1 hypothetical protein CEXT_467851 [Caerostris extrusa]
MDHGGVAAAFRKHHVRKKLCMSEEKAEYLDSKERACSCLHESTSTEQQVSEIRSIKQDIKTLPLVESMKIAAAFSDGF